MVRNRSLQHGHLFSVWAHLSMQSKQNLWVHPLTLATSVMEAGASRQMAQVKSGGGFIDAPPPAEGAATATPKTLAAGFISISSISSSSSSSSSNTIGVSFVPRAAAFLLAAGEAVLPMFPPTAAVVARRRGWGDRRRIEVAAILVAAQREAARLERLGAGVGEELMLCRIGVQLLLIFKLKHTKKLRLNVNVLYVGDDPELSGGPSRESAT
mmetsp:Transcript_37908/g.91454  ORF Transcript_37908/g.91454 Transcript_37908/m.91454 type:complete len:212 (+) Transcript_37908:907-1542(+)